MKLLIVEDNESLAEITAELLMTQGGPENRFEAITVAGDLETAICRLPGHDMVLCDGTFPLSPESPYVVDDWDVVRQEAQRRGIHFVLYSGSVCALDSARESNTPALIKPAAIEEIYAALTTRREPIYGPGRAVKAPKENNPVRPEKPSPPAMEEYCRNLEMEADAIARQAEIDARVNHLEAFNFGRSLARLENARAALRLRILWLLFGAAAGLIIATLYFQAHLNPQILQIPR
jgi:CheY-like chemotaxis protein